MDFLYGVRLHLNMILPDVLIDIILDYFTQLLWSDIYGTVLRELRHIFVQVELNRRNPFI